MCAIISNRLNPFLDLIANAHQCAYKNINRQVALSLKLNRKSYIIKLKGNCNLTQQKLLIACVEINAVGFYTKKDYRRPSCIW